MPVILGNGLEEIGEYAFGGCTSLISIKIAPAVRAIQNWEFSYCSGLMTVILGNGLEEIGEYAFDECMSLLSIKIPSAIRVIHKTAFNECSKLMTVRFCNEIKEFISRESRLVWWNHGVHEKCLITYCFFIQCNIPERMDQVQSTTLQSKIHGMLNGIPSIYPKVMNDYFCSIDSKLYVYEYSTLLELAIWKAKIAEQTDGAISPLDCNMMIAY
jgi:hypothetical protein